MTQQQNLLLESDRLIKLKEVKNLTGMSKTTIYKRTNEGTFPKKIKIFSSTRWSFNDIQQWINERKLETNSFN